MNCKTPKHIIITIILLEILNQLSELQCYEYKNNPKGKKRTTYYRMIRYFDKMILNINLYIL